ncbi:hypothetical protein Tco_0309987, partial [Tanacetum coccineum]
DSSTALDASLVIIESKGTESQKHDTSNRSGNDAHVNDADIRPIYNEEPMDEVQTTDDNVSATGQQHTEQPEFNNEGKVDQNAEQYHEIQDLKAQMQDKNMVINELKKLILVTKGKSVETQFDKPSVVRQPNALIPIVGSRLTLHFITRITNRIKKGEREMISFREREMREKKDILKL